MSARELRERMQSRWLKFIASLCASGIDVGGSPSEVFANLDHCYSQEHRHYHGWRHIASCLDELEQTRSFALHPAAVEMAVWFHDVVYIPGAPDNEVQSALIARSAAESMNLPPATVSEVADLVLATRYFEDEGAGEEVCPVDRALIRDIDLAILGKPRNEFDRYEEAIGREHGYVPQQERWQRRIGILQGFLDLPRIYETEYFHKRYEQRARRNLSHSLSRLRKLLGG